MYDPTVGRFLEEDPGEYEDGDINLYRYDGNDPTSMALASAEPPGAETPTLQGPTGGSAGTGGGSIDGPSSPATSPPLPGPGGSSGAGSNAGSGLPTITPGSPLWWTLWYLYYYGGS